MGRLKKVGKAIGLIAAALLLVGAGVYTWLSYSTGKTLNRELKALKDSGAPLTPTEVAPPLLPDEENAAVIYQKAFLLMQEGNEEEKKSFQTVFKAGGYINWPEANIFLVRSLLKKNEGALNLARQATLIEKCRFPLEYEKGPKMLLPHLSKMARLARLLALKAGLQSREGQTDESLKTIQVGLRLGKSLLAEPICISQLVRISINIIVLNEMEMILDQKKTQPTTYEDLIRELDGLEGRRAFTRSLEGERAIWLWAFKEPSMAVEYPGEYRLYGSYLLRPILKMDEVHYLRMMGRIIALSRLPYYQAIARVKDFKKELGDVPRYCYLTRILVPALNNAFVRQTQSEAQIRAAKLALALKIYKAKKGTYPLSLKALTPEILPQLPQDPFTGKDYIYRREGEGFIVYSLGLNLKDDQGAFERTHWKEGDIPWRVRGSSASKTDAE